MYGKHGAPPRLPAVAPGGKHHTAGNQQREAAGSQRPQWVFLRGLLVPFVAAFFDRGCAPTDLGVSLIAAFTRAMVAASLSSGWLLHETKEAGWEDLAESL